MTTKTPTHTRYLKIHDDVWEALKKEAERDHRTVTNLVQKILGEWVKGKKEGGASPYPPEPWGE